MFSLKWSTHPMVSIHLHTVQYRKILETKWKMIMDENQWKQLNVMLIRPSKNQNNYKYLTFSKFLDEGPNMSLSSSLDTCNGLCLLTTPLDLLDKESSSADHSESLSSSYRKSSSDTVLILV